MQELHESSRIREAWGVLQSARCIFLFIWLFAFHGFFFYLEKLYKQKGQSVHFLSMQHHSALQGMREHRRLVFSISLQG